MSKVDEIREMAAAGMVASAIAARLGVSRSGVYKAAVDNQIELPRALAVREGPTKPRARVITGGIEQPINASTAGCIAELLAAADLMARGWQVFLPIVKNRGHDLVATRGAEIVTVEVRSSYRNAAGTLIFPKKPDCLSSHYALVVTGEPVSYRPDLPEIDKSPKI